MADTFVIVHRTSDPIQADLLGALLREQGLAARVLGIRYGSSIGVGQHLAPMRIEVPRSQAGAATDFLEAYFEQDGEALLAAHGGWEQGASGDGDGNDDGDGNNDGAASATSAAAASGAPASTEAPAGSSPLWAALAALFPFGGSHWYTRRPLTATCVGVGQLLATTTLFTLCSNNGLHGILMFFALVGVDLAAGQQAARARRQGLRASLSRQLVIGAALVTAAGLASTILASAMSGPDSDRLPALPTAQQPASP
ncbi:MAG: hypothetical protein Tsb0020_11120 [Haliangiales bacterium]